MAAGIYLHIPFCRSRCTYCDFATDVYRDADSVDRYVNALVREIDSFGSGKVEPVDTIYFGGGTPSLLSADKVEQIKQAIHRKFDISDVGEITMEMNPATVSPETLRGYRSLGVNRASFGAQTFNDRALKLLARGHDANDARETFKMLRDAGFDNVSFDMIAGLPSQTLKDWEKNLDEAISLSPEHLSLYLLEIHQGTPLAEQVRSGRQPLPDEDLAAAMYEMMLDRLADAGYEQYEISNFSRPGFESRHNTKYWTLDPVFGFGVSAHSFDGEHRYANDRNTTKYIEQVKVSGSAVVERNKLTRKQLSAEFAFLSLRLNRGLDITAYRSRFGIDLMNAMRGDLLRLQDAELVTVDDQILRLTRKGMIYSNEVFLSFV